MQRIIVDRWSGRLKPITGTNAIVCDQFAVREFIKLSNGIWLRNLGNGRLVNDVNEGERWAEVLNWDSDLDYGEKAGYTRLG